MTAPDRPARQQAAASIAGRIDWTPTYLAEFGERAAIVEQVLRLAEYESAAEVRALRAETERKVSIDVRMERPPAPDWGGEEDDDGVQLYHHAWESTDEMLRLWVGPYAVGDSGPWWAVTVNAPGIDLVMRCTPDEVVEWADMVKEAVTDGPALLARTPQPAGVVNVDSNERAYIADAMRHGAGVLTRLGHKTSNSADRYNDARSEPLNRVARHYYRAADVIRDAAAAYVSAPLPAVPDGEDEPDWHNMRERLHTEISAIVGVGSREDRTGDADGDLIERVRRAVVAPRDGEDVPARLDAAAEALADNWQQIGAGMLHDVAHLLRGDPDLCAAVAAALARPTEREQ